MEGWDGTLDGKPTDLVAAALDALRHLRRQADLGRRGRGRPAGRARQSESALLRGKRAALATLLPTLKAAHRKRFGMTDDLFVGLQLTHSGRWSRPDPDHAASAAHRVSGIR